MRKTGLIRWRRHELHGWSLNPRIEESPEPLYLLAPGITTNSIRALPEQQPRPMARQVRRGQPQGRRHYARIASAGAMPKRQS